MRKNSIKNTRINGEIQRELSNIIRTELKDPRIGMMTSVTDVEAAPDLKTCKVYISVLEKGTIQQVLGGLKSAGGYLRREIGAKLQLRYTPELHFVEDTAMEHGERIFEILRTLDIPEDSEADGHAD